MKKFWLPIGYNMLVAVVLFCLFTCILRGLMMTEPTWYEWVLAVISWYVLFRVACLCAYNYCVLFKHQSLSYCIGNACIYLVAGGLCEFFAWKGECNVWRIHSACVVGSLFINLAIMCRSWYNGWDKIPPYQRPYGFWD